MNKQKIKVAYVINSIRNNGPSNIVISLINSIDNSRFEPSLITIFDENDNLTMEKINKKVKVHTMKFKSRFSASIFGPKAISAIIKQNHIDVIHTHGFIPDLISSRIKGKVNKISTIHNIIKEDYNETYGYLMGKIFATVHLSRLRNIDIVVGCSTAVSSSLSKEGITNVTVNNGIIPVTNIKKTIQRKDLGIDNESVVLIYAGNLDRRKNIVWLKKQFETIHKKNEYLLILGKGKNEKIIKNNHDKNILFLGFVENVYDYMFISDIYVSASKSEGLPVSVIQAMSSGLYLLLSNIPSHETIIKQNHNIGELFNKNDFSKKYRKAISNYKKINKKYIIDTQIKEYSVSEMQNGYSKLYEGKI